MLSIIGRFVPVAFSLLSLWIKAFDRNERLTRPGRFILMGLAASAILVYTADQLDKRLSKISSDREKQEALYQQIASLDSLGPGDVVLTLSGTSESANTKVHPKFLFHDWEVILTGDGPKENLVGVAIRHQTSSELANDEIEGTYFEESRTFSQFTGEFERLRRAEAWNGAKLHIVVKGERGFFPRDCFEWVMEDEVRDFAWESKEKIDALPKPNEDSYRVWTMLPMSIHAELLVRNRLLAESDGYIVYERRPDDFLGYPGTVYVVMPSLVVGANAFPTKDDVVRPTSLGDLATCMRLRIIAWACCLVAIFAGGIAAWVQLRSRADPASEIAQIDAP